MDRTSSQHYSDMPRSARRVIQPTKPIEIPSRRKHAISSSPYLSPIRDQMSPDLIFEMSPLASEFPHSDNGFPVRSSTLKNANEPEPYLYPFPIFSPRNFSALRRPSYTPPPAPVITRPSQNYATESVDNFHFDAWPKPPTTIPGNGAQNQNDGSPTIKGIAKQKITGFVPLYPSPVSDSSTETTRHRERLSPTPRYMSPWTNPLDDPDELEASIQKPFDFDSFMIRRVNETRKSLLHCPSNLRLAHRY